MDSGAQAILIDERRYDRSHKIEHSEIVESLKSLQINEVLLKNSTSRIGQELLEHNADLIAEHQALLALTKEQLTPV